MIRQTSQEVLVVRDDDQLEVGLSPSIRDDTDVSFIPHILYRGLLSNARDCCTKSKRPNWEEEWVLFATEHDRGLPSDTGGRHSEWETRLERVAGAISIHADIVTRQSSFGGLGSM